MEHSIAQWLGLARRADSPGRVAMERSIRLPRVLMVAAGRHHDDAAAIQAEMAYRRLRADGWPVGKCHLSDVSRLPGKADRDEFNGSRVSCIKQLARSLPRWDVVHVFVSTLSELISFSLPAVLLGRFFGRKIVVHIYSSHLEDWFERWGRILVPVLRQADLVVVPDGGRLDSLQGRRLTATELPVLVDHRLFAVREIDSLQPRILVTRALEPHANPTLILRAFRIVKQKYPRAELVVVGEGSLRAELEDLIESDRINGVTFLGSVAHEEMADHYSDVDLYINGSFRPDIPVSLLEASSCGLPVISLGRHEKSLSADVGNHVDLANLILQLVENTDEVRRLSASARETRATLDWSCCRKRWTRLYLDLAGRSGR